MKPLSGCTMLAGALALASLGAGGAAAQSVRVVVLPKLSIAGKPRPQAPLDAKVADSLRALDMRVVDLDTALSAQRAAFSDSVQAGKLPDALSTLNADVVASVQLACERSSDGVMGSKIQSYYCVLNSKVIRVDSGDVILADSASWTGHGLNAQMALQGVLDKHVGSAVQVQARSFAQALSASNTWEIDLVVTRVSDRATARTLATLLNAMPDITDVRLLVFQRGLAKLAVSGQGVVALENLAGALEQHPRLALSVTYETPRVLHAELDHDRAHRCKTIVMAVAAEGAGSAELAPDLVAATLANLPYLTMVHSRPRITDLKGQAALEERLRAQAREHGVPLLTVVSVLPQAQGYSASIKLVETKRGKILATASGHGSGFGDAADAAARALDPRYRAAVAEANTRRELGLPKQAAVLAQDEGLIVHAFKVPVLPPRAKQVPTGTLELVNRSKQKITAASMALRTAEGPLTTRPVPDLGPGERVAVPVPLDGIERDDARALRLTAEIRYRVGDGYGKVSAFTPLLVGNPEAKGARLQAEQRDPKGYHDAVNAALARFNAGDPEQARVHFLRAHEIYPNARTLRALGMVEYDLGHYAKATEYLQRSLHARQRPLTPTLRDGVQQLLRRAQASSI